MIGEYSWKIHVAKTYLTLTRHHCYNPLHYSTRQFILFMTVDGGLAISIQPGYKNVVMQKWTKYSIISCIILFRASTFKYLTKLFLACFACLLFSFLKVFLHFRFSFVSLCFFYGFLSLLKFSIEVKVANILK